MKHKQSQGFTLLEVAIALLIISLLVFGGVTMYSTDYQQSKQKAVSLQLEEIKKLMLGFVRVNGYLPCPDKLTGTHSGDGGADRKSSGACATREGYLPTKTLGMSQTKDPWGNKFYYRVNARAEDLTRVTDICESASVFGAKRPDGTPVAGTKDANFAQCQATKMYFCRACSTACSSICNFSVDPRPHPSAPPYFHSSTRPVAAEPDGFKNLEIKDENGNLVESVDVAVIVSFGSNGRYTWADSAHCPSTLPADEKENCDNDVTFIRHRIQDLDDYVIGITLNDVKAEEIKAGLPNY